MKSIINTVKNMVGERKENDSSSSNTSTSTNTNAETESKQQSKNVKQEDPQQPSHQAPHHKKEQPESKESEEGKQKSSSSSKGKQEQEDSKEDGDDADKKRSKAQEHTDRAMDRNKSNAKEEEEKEPGAKGELGSSYEKQMKEAFPLQQPKRKNLSIQEISGVQHPKISVEEYVKSHGGNRAITRILIANNGIAAVKAIRSIRKWAYDVFGDDRAIQFIVMATPDDIKANAAYIHLADEFVPVPGGANNNNYANVTLICDIAERTGADAVWAGWGHASENPKLPDTLAKTKNRCVWMGPPSSAMRALGDKIGSTIIAQTAGVPCMPWSGDGLKVNYAEEGMPEDVYMKGCIKNAKQAREHAERIGLPVMIKASEGGGGKGIRKVEKMEAIESAFHQVQSEVPGSPIFLMKLAPECRHLETQLLADQHGNAIAVFGRDCSIQRRHQKIIEEGPVIAAPPDVWRHMEKSAIRLAKEVGYVGAGTVEWLYTTTGDYYFLELNPRLQVEHPVTELISGVNLPAGQLQVAMGIPLNRIRGVRRMYGEKPDDDTPIDFDNKDAHTLGNHVIACRITAENPDSEFQPTSGVIQELNFRSTADVWGYFSVSARGGVHEFSDSQFGHLFASGETRELARRHMSLALKELSIRGDIRTTVEYLQMILESDDFKNNRLSTTWLEKLMASRKGVMDKPPTYLAVILGALYRAFRAFSERYEDYMEILKRGQLPSSDQHGQLVRHKAELIYDGIKYLVQVSKCGEHLYHIQINNWNTMTEVHRLSDDGLLTLIDARKHVVYGQEFASGMRLTVDGKVCLFQKEYDPSNLRATMQGKLIRYTVKDGSHIEKDQPYAEVEVMKMILTLTAPEPGVLNQVKNEGSVIEAGELIATIKLDHPETVKKAELFEGEFKPLKGPHYLGDNSATILTDALDQLQNCSDGYYLPENAMQQAVGNLMSALRDPSLPLDQMNHILSTLIGRIPEELYERISTVLNNYRGAISANRFYWESPSMFPTLELQQIIDEALKQTDEDDRNRVTTLLQPITLLLSQYTDGNHSYAINVLTKLLESYYEIESHFNNDLPLDSVVRNLKKQYSDIGQLAKVASAHYQLQSRNLLIVKILDIIESQLTPMLGNFLPIFHKLSSLTNKEYAIVALKARQLIMKQQMPSAEQRRIAIGTILSAAATVAPEQRGDRLAPLIDQSQPIEDLIFQFFTPQNKPGTQAAAVEAYIRRTYQVFDIRDVVVNVGHHVYKGLHGATMSSSGSSKALIKARWEFYSQATVGSSSNVSAESHLPQQQGQGQGQQEGQQQQQPPQQQQQQGSYLMSKAHSFGNVANAASKQQPSSQQQQQRQQAPAKGARQESNGLYNADDDSDSGKKSQETKAPTNVQRSVSSQSAGGPPQLRVGLLAFFMDFDTVKKEFQSLLNELEGYDNTPASTSPSSQTPNVPNEPPHVVYIAVQWNIAHAASQSRGSARTSGSEGGNTPTHPVKQPAEELLSSMFRAFLAGQETLLQQRGVRRVTFIITPDKAGEYPYYFTYRSRLSFEEDTLIRHIEPSYAHYMQLQRFANFDIQSVPTNNRMVHVFAAYPAKEKGKGLALPPSTSTSKQAQAHAQRTERASQAPYSGQRFFVRSLIRKLDSAGLYDEDNIEDLDLDAHPETEVAFVEALNALEIAMGGETKKWRFNSVFLNMLVETTLTPEYIEAVIRLLGRRYDNKLRRLNVALVELSVAIRTGGKDQQRQKSTTGRLSTDDDDVKHYRFVCTNPTGYLLNIDLYLETADDFGKQVFKYLKPKRGISRVTEHERGVWDGQEITEAYPTTSKLQHKRMVAESMDTIYAYDFLPLIELAVEKQWRMAARSPVYTEGHGGYSEHRRRRTRANSLMNETSNLTLRALKEEEETEERNVPDKLMTVTELILRKREETNKDAEQKQKEDENIMNLSVMASHNYELIDSDRSIGQNDVGMIAWRITLYTPQYPNGRDIVIISNDITHQAGTFGPLEDILFDLASRHSRERHIPRIYMAANSGARIGLAEELRHKFKITWINNDPKKGVDYLYLSPDDYKELQKSVICTTTKANVDGKDEERYIIKDIVGIKDGLNVENLRGSGTIASETSLAYNEVFTLTYVTGRTVGIGAYLCRLGQRVIQKQTPPIILTGFNALNKLLGQSVYTSNVQLGGIDIMYPNGVTHVVVNDDLHGVMKCLQWLSYIPATRLALPPIPNVNNLFDRIDRKVDYKPNKGQMYDPRQLLTGTYSKEEDSDKAKQEQQGQGDDSQEQGHWLSGLFDRGSWIELLGGWAKGVVTGRARLGGVPIGIVAVETRTTERMIPADPADPSTKEQIRQMPGGVWFPDSAYKTAQAIWDVSNEGLPIVIFANWRGFSGGARDMFEEVLKFGSYIVDALRTFKQPIFIYMPPHATLRGGAWVVVDPTINTRMMEMYADPTARGGVLEVEGTLEVKFRRHEILALMHRLDHKLQDLDKELKDESADKKETEKAIKKRESELYPLYQQGAALFADLHDTPGRMKAKGCISGVVDWSDSRQFLYWRLRRRLLETHAIKRVLAAQREREDDEPAYQQAEQLVRSWITDSKKDIYKNNQLVVDWFDTNAKQIDSKIQELTSNSLMGSLKAVIESADKSGHLESGLTSILKSLTAQQQKAIRSAIQKL